jgi:DNA-binding NarL/FixJ family response regulator
MAKKLKIQSAEQAFKESLALPSIWSDESRLTQRILVYIAELLERQTKPAPKKKRPLSEWQKHVQKSLKAGKSIKQAAKEWNGWETGRT